MGPCTHIVGLSLSLSVSLSLSTYIYIHTHTVGPKEVLSRYVDPWTLRVQVQEGISEPIDSQVLKLHKPRTIIGV